MTDENLKDVVGRLLKEARAGSGDALEELKKRYSPLIESCAHRFIREGMTSQDKEDIREETLINFFNAVYSFDPSFEGVEFGLYAKICIENGLVSFMRSFARRNRLSQISLDDISTSVENKDKRDMLSVIAEREQTLILAKRISDCLSSYENKIWWMYVSGLSVREIASRLGVESKSVSNAVFRIRQKLSEMVRPSQN